MNTARSHIVTPVQGTRAGWLISLSLGPARLESPDVSRADLFREICIQRDTDSLRRDVTFQALLCFHDLTMYDLWTLTLSTMQVRHILAQKSYLACPDLTEHTGCFLWKIKGSSVSSHQHTWIPLLVNVNTDNSLNHFWNKQKKNLCSNLATRSVLSQSFNYHCGLFSHKMSVPSVIVNRKWTILRKLWNLEKHLLQYTTCFIYFHKMNINNDAN